MSDVDTYLVPVVGMPRKVAEAVAVMSDLWPLDDGPAHVVIADWNLSDGILRACIASIDKGETYSNEYEGRPDHPIYAATRAVLVWLLENVPEDERENWERYPATPSDASPQSAGRALDTAQDGTVDPAAVSLASLGAAVTEADGNPPEQTAPCLCTWKDGRNPDCRYPHEDAA